MKRILTFSTILLNAPFVIASFASATQLYILPPADGGTAAMCETIYINMYDSFGDGWNGATMTIYNWDNNVVWNGTMLTGSSASYNTCLTAGCYTIVVTGGSFAAEISWVIDDGIYWLTDGVAPSTSELSVGAITPGCMDFEACNYNYSANCNEGCCYTDCFQFDMFDSAGNGWDGYTAHLVDNNGVLVFEATLYSAYQQITGCLPHPGCYQIYFTGQTNLSELYWELATSTDPPPLYPIISSESGDGGGYFGTVGSPCESGCANPDACNYSNTAMQDGSCCLHNCAGLDMNSSNSNGWGGGGYTLTNWRGEVSSYGNLFSGLSGFEGFCLPDGCYELAVAQAPWNINWSFEVQGGNAYEGDGGDVVTIQIGTMVQGCTDPAASNYNHLANCNSGICNYTCESDLDGNGQVNVSDLLIFTSQFGTVCN